MAVIVPLNPAMAGWDFDSLLKVAFRLNDVTLLQLQINSSLNQLLREKGFPNKIAYKFLTPNPTTLLIKRCFGSLGDTRAITSPFSMLSKEFVIMGQL